MDDSRMIYALKMCFITYEIIIKPFTYKQLFIYFCSVIRNQTIQLQRGTMEDLEKRIEDLKTKISDYIKISEMFDFPKKEGEIQINLMLEDLQKLINKRDEEK